MKHLESIAEKLVTELKSVDVDCYIWHVATTGSIYIRFSDSRMCSIRIGNHPGREHLKYKYNIRNDLKLSSGKWKKDGNQWRYYLPIGKWKEIIPLLTERKQQISTWQKTENKYEYKIPHFKK